MGSKGRIPPPHLRHPIPGSSMVHPDTFSPGVCPPPAPFPPFDILPPPEVMEQKLAAQHVEMQRLATENQRLAATHGTLRQELAAAQHELQMLHARIGAIKTEREQQMIGLLDKIAKMEAELKKAEPIRSELQQARTDAEKLVVERQELMSQLHHIAQDLQKVHFDVQEIPILMSELESLRHEYQQCRMSYDYEKKLFNDHLESLQVMEKNYITMAKEVEKLRSELTNTANVDIRTVAGVPYGGTTVNNDGEASGRFVGRNAYEDTYAVRQGQGNSAAPPNSGTGTANAGAAANVGAATGMSTFLGAQSGSGPAKTGHDAPRVPGYDPPRVTGYDVPRGHGYDAQRGPGYDMPRGPGYDPQRAPAYEPQRVPSYDVQTVPFYNSQRGAVCDVQRGHNYDASRGAPYDAAVSRGAAGPHGQLTPTNNVPYGSATPPTRAGSSFEVPARGGNPNRK